jgi:hypothetical protein
MSTIGRHMRVALANDLGVAIPSGTVLTVTCRRWRFDSTGKLVWEGSDQALGWTLGSSLSSGSQAADGSALDNTNSGDGWIGAQFLVSVPSLAVAPTAGGTIQVWLQTSLDGSTWADDPNLKRGILLFSEAYPTTNPTGVREASTVV